MYKRIRKIKDFRIEQFTPKKTAGNWSVIVSYLMENNNRPISKIPAIDTFGSYLPYERVFKEIRIDEEGNVVEMLMYKNEK